MRKLPFFVAAAATLGLVGCGSMPAQQQQASYEIDHQKVQLVNQYALHRGMGVHWVNYPTRQVDQAKAQQVR